MKRIAVLALALVGLSGCVCTQTRNIPESPRPTITYCTCVAHP